MIGLYSVDSVFRDYNTQQYVTVKNKISALKKSISLPMFSCPPSHISLQCLKITTRARSGEEMINAPGKISEN